MITLHSLLIYDSNNVQLAILDWINPSSRQMTDYPR